MELEVGRAMGPQKDPSFQRNTIRADKLEAMGKK